MKVLLSVFLALCCAVTGGCFASEAPMRSLHIFSSVVEDALLNIDNAISAERTPLEFISGDIAVNCTDYFRLRQKYDVVESVNNIRIAQGYILCDTLRILQGAKQRIFADSGISSPGDALANNLLVDSYPSSLYQRTDTNKNSLRSLLNTSLNVERYAIISDTSDWYYELKIVSVADVDGNGMEDWVIWLTDRAKQGNYNVMSVLVALNVDANEPIQLSKF